MEALKQNLDPKWFGNIKGVSTSQGLIDILHTLHEYAEIPGSISSMMLCKAFNHIDHMITLSKF